MANYYNRYDPAKQYEQHLFSADRVLQSAELNELQSSLIDRISNVGSVLFKDGDIIRDAGCFVDATTGETRLVSGALWLAGAVRGIGPATFTIPVAGSIVLGVYLQETTVTELEDPSLLNPAVGTHGYMEPGASRLQIIPVWGQAGDGKSGKFYPVYEVVDGVLKAKEAPPTIDAVSVAMQKYDRDSTGGCYIINGMDVSKGTELDGDKQTYIVSAGAARVNGKQVELRAATRYLFAAAPDLKMITDEPHVSSGPAAQRIDVDYGPIAALEQVALTAERTVTLTHGVVAGSQDPLPDTSVLQIVSIIQGGTTFTNLSDYKLTAGRVDWSPPGAEPAAGSTYVVKYQYITTVTPTDVDSTGFTVTGAVKNSLILASYSYKVPRVDRLCLDDAGDIVTIKGVASDWMPPPPSVPADLLLLATIYQQWNSSSRMSKDSPRMVPMAELAHVQDQLDGLKQLVAQQVLQSDAMSRETVLKKGVFVDPLLDDSMRDDGVFQYGAIVGGALTLPIDLAAVRFKSDVSGPTTLAYTVVPLVEQSRRTGAMAVNPYQAFSPVPATVTLDPNSDQMTYTTESWTSDLTSRIVQRVPYGGSAGPASTTAVQTISTTRNQDQIIRPITITFTLDGFDAGETVVAASFDGIAVVPGTLASTAVRPVADDHGKATGTFNIPSNVPVGRKLVQVIGSNGSYGSAYYSAASWSEDRVLQRVITEYAYEFDPPPPPVVPVQIPVTVVVEPDRPIKPVDELPPYPKEPSKPELTPLQQQINGIYEKYFGREAEPAGLDYWTETAKNYNGSVPLLDHILYAAVGGDKETAGDNQTNWDKVRAANPCANKIDPLAQTFVPPTAAHLVGVDLWFEAVGNSDVVVQLRSVASGFPTQQVLAEARLKPSDITTHDATRAIFALPYYAAANEELAFVVMCDDATTSLSIAELGKWDGTAWITAQAYTVGVMLSSSNNSTWTVHQDRDLRFRILAANYTETVRTVDLGKIPVTGITDLMVLGLEQKPGPHASISYTVVLPDGSEITASNNQPLTLPAPITGNVALRANLQGDAIASPVLHRGGQLMGGCLASTGDYVSRAVPAGTNSRVRVVVDALLPSGSTLTVQLKGTDQGDSWSSAIPQINATALDNGWYELTFEQTGINEAMVQTKLVLNGSAAARPFVRNPRVMVM